MPVTTPLPLIFNTFTLALAMSFLLIILWYDVRRRVNQFFALFLILFGLWNIGFLLDQVTALISPTSVLPKIAFALSQIGFTGSSITLYALFTVLVGVQPRRFRLLTFLYLWIAVSYTALQANPFLSVRDYSFINESFAVFMFLIFDALTIYVVWRYRRKLQNMGLIAGVFLFTFGQGTSFINPDLGIFPFSTSLSSIGVLVISFSIVQRELITPLLERGTQLEAMHDVSLSITSRLDTEAVLNEIARRAANWLGADAAGIFLKRGNTINLVAIHNLPTAVLETAHQLGSGVAGTVALTKESVYLEHYGRDWNGAADLPMAKETFGSVIGVPLIFDDNVIGTLLVISGAQGHLLDKDDVKLLELLASQAAVAISHGKLFAEQKHLTNQVATAHEQLRTVLVSTESPVIAVDRNLKLIFANPAAESLFDIHDYDQVNSIVDIVPQDALPASYREVIQSIEAYRAFSYEVFLKNKTYLCHVASLGEHRIEGWVAVLNDVSKLKELDRIKSEMVRMTSHDLKNPLQAAMANLELLKDDIESIEDEEISLSVNNIDKQLHKMNRIIGGILDLERVRMGANPVELCQPEMIVKHAIDELTDMAADNRIKLLFDMQAGVANFMGDIEQFERALVNLIENAIKFSPAESAIQITAKNEADAVVFIVADKGIGIPQELQPKIFERFYRGHQAGAEHISGSGLGLSLVKTVVESHNGQIWMESDSEVGTTFYISVPAVSTMIGTK